MEEERELKHVCKFCSKSFSCGRSLGGHMRSHMINDITAQSDGTKLTKKKLPSLAINNGPTNDASNSYALRENPNKTRRILDHPKCGKVFQSWKTPFGHPKCHTVEKEKFLIMKDQEQEEQNSWTSTMDSHSDNETTAVSASASALYRTKRSQKKTTQIMGTTANSSSSLSFAKNNASSSVSEIEQEQEEVAISLMMLSRDVAGGLHSVAESSDNSSVFLENKIETLKKIKRKKIDHSALGVPRKGISKELKPSRIDSSETTQLSSDPDESNLLTKSNKNKISISVDDFEKRVEAKKSKGHVCTVCFKVFPSGQALGGHKRSHLVATSVETKNDDQILAIQELPIRDFLDLNFPAPSEEDNSVLNQRWIASSYKQDSLLGLISN